MNTIILLNKLREQGIGIRLVDDQLKVNAPKEKLTPALLKDLKDKKDDIIAFFRAARVEGDYSPIKPIEVREYYVLSSAQKRMYILQQMALDSTIYNTPLSVVITESLDRDKLAEVFRELIVRHESFRTSFLKINEEPVQRVHSEVEFEIEYYHSISNEIETTFKHFIRPFNLSRPPLLRVGLIEQGHPSQELTHPTPSGYPSQEGIHTPPLPRQEHPSQEGKYVLMIDMHHIISDGVSLQNLINEFRDLCQGALLPKLLIQYRDYAQWQNKERIREKIEQQQEFWLKEFGDEIPVLEYPTDYSRPAVQSYEGSVTRFKLGDRESRTLSQLAMEHGTTLFMLCLALFDILLSKLSGQEDVVVGTPIAGRRHADLHSIIGMFVNTLALRNYPAGEKRFVSFLREVRANTLSAFDNQEYQFEDLVERVAVNRDVSRSPVFDVMFVMQNTGENDSGATNLENESSVQDNLFDFGYKISKFDMTWNLSEEPYGLLLVVEYCTKLFKQATIERFVAYYKNILDFVIAEPGARLAEIAILSREERKQILNEFNDTKVDYPAEQTIHDLFEEQVMDTPHAVAVVSEEEYLSYQELNHQSYRLSSCLFREGVKKDSAVGIMGGRCPEVSIGLLAILKAGGIYLPINIDYPLERQEYLIKDSGAEILLTTPGTEVNIGKEKIRPICISSYLSVAGAGLDLISGSVGALDPAYIIYTSGSTGNPKGVIVTHRNVARLVKNTNFMTFKPGGRILQTGALEFDASTFEIWGSLLNGLTLYLFDKARILAPPQLKYIIDSCNIDTVWMTSPLFNQMLTENIEIFSGLSNLLVGGDILSPLHINRLRERFPGLNVINGYGPTENTTFSTTFLIDREYREGIPIGRPIANSAAYIMDRHNNLQPVGVAGELWVGGDGVSRGYLNDPDLTAGKFVTAPVASGMPQAQRLYRTGDLARWQPTGVIEFLGRIDFQVKIRGFRIELGEIESSLLSHPDIKEAVVIARAEKQGDKSICAYIVPLPAGEASPNTLRRYLAATLPDYMIPSYFVSLNQIPLTSNGKVDRRALPEPSHNGPKTHKAPANEIEERLVEIWSALLSIDRDHIGTDASFFELGGHSLKATILSGHLHREFDVEVPLVEIFRIPTIEELSAYIQEASAERFVALEAVEWREYYELSSAQKRMYILQQMDLDSRVYNMPQVWSLKETIDQARLDQVFRELTVRHESFRTSFLRVNEEPVQRVYREVDFEIEYYNTTHSVDSIIKQFVRPFDLSKPPLLRVGLIETGHPSQEGKYVIVVDMHHIISDGTSMQVLVDEFWSLYRGEELPALRIQYKDFSLWQNSDLVKKKINNQEAYWLAEFAGEIPVLNLPSDYPRPAEQSFEGGMVGFEFDSKESAGLSQLALDSGVTLFMVLTALFTLTLSKLSGQEDIVIGTPTAGRRHADLEHVIGMFVNTLALRNYPRSDKRFSDFLQEVKSKTVNAFENQEYPFEDLVEKVEVVRDVSRNPLFDVMLVLQNMGDGSIARGGDNFLADSGGNGNGGFENPVSRFDMTWSAIQREGRIYWGIEYCTRLFKLQTIQKYTHHYKTLMDAVTADPGARLADLDILSADERNQILHTFNDTRQAYTVNMTVHEVFDHRAAEVPDRMALCLSDQCITYGELHKQMDRLALLLIERGVQPETPVGLRLNRSVEMVVGILGILKAGGAYVPIDIGFPIERVGHILWDSQIQLLVAESDQDPGLEYDGEVLSLDEMVSRQREKGEFELMSRPSDLIYIIYTSGSTGRPKGILINHTSVVNILYHLEALYPVDPDGSYLMKTNYTFDVSVTELFGWFFGGGRLVILEPGAEKDPAEIIKTVEKFAVTHINFVPSMLQVFMEVASVDGGDSLGGLRYILVAGEAFSTALASQLSSLDMGARVENIYGPTEAAIYTTRYSLSDFESTSMVPIGRPLSNIVTYVVNGNSTLLPVNVWGELCIGGIGLARGYLNRPELTAERFVRHPRLQPESRILYRTGDRARFLPDGNIEFSGRMDFQVKLRGLRLELGEIEAELLQHPDIKEAVVIIRGDGWADQFLCAYVVSQDDNMSVSDLRDSLSRRLPDYMIPSQFVRLESMPLNPAGKVDRKALPAPETRIDESYIAPRNLKEKRLVAIWSDLLGISENEIGIDANFFKLGGNSLKAIKLLARLHSEFNVEIPLSAIFKTFTIKGLVKYIDSTFESKFSSIELAKSQEYYPLSSAQQRLYILQQMEPGSTVYNMPQLVRPLAKLNRSKLAQTFKQLIKRHESLRTSFVKINDEPVQIIHKEVTFDVESLYLNEKCSAGVGNGLSKQSEEDIIKDFVRPFDLSRPPLMRVGLIEAGHPSQEGKYVIVVDMHHIISDGTSMRVLVNEFWALYKSEKLPALRIQYKDFSLWQNSDFVKKKINNQEAYWLAEFAGEIPVLNLPTDYPRPAVQSFEGGSVGFEFDLEESAGLSQLALDSGVTLFMVLTALFTLTLSKLSGQEDIVIGTPTAGRRHADLERVIGMFVNTLGLRNYPRSDKRFSEFLKEVKSKTVKAFENQEYPFEDLVEKVEVIRDVSRNPLFDVMLVMHNMEDESGIRDGENFLALSGGKGNGGFENPVSRFDMTWNAIQREGRIDWGIEYCIRLFERQTIHRYADCFKTITDVVLTDPEVKIDDIDIVSADERNQIMHMFNDTRHAYPKNLTVHEVFDHRAGEVPDRMALCLSDQCITYGELHKQTDRLALLLMERGVKPETPVGLRVNRSVEMVMGVLGILKAGGAYVPLDVGFPKERILHILTDSQARLLISHSDQAPGLEYDGQVIFLDEMVSRRPETGKCGIVSRPSALIYIIYTAGSTGRPKGILINHTSVVNILYHLEELYPLGPGGSYLLKTNYTFDVSVTELFGWFFGGGGLVILEPGAEKDPAEIIKTVEKFTVTHINFVPSMLQVFLEVAAVDGRDSLGGLRYILVAGEAFSTALASQLSSLDMGARVENIYGPTEAAIYTTRYSLSDFESMSMVPIGRPLNNVVTYVVSGDNALLPVKVWGELCIGGIGLARGYLNRPELTAERFVRPLKLHPESRILYRTGDRARFLPDGNIEFSGRMDFQVKLRGLRLELGEIEAELLLHPDIKEAVVTIRGDGWADQFLCAYVVSQDDKMSVSDLRDSLSRRLPEYMIPSRFVRLESMPLNPAGKVDRKALPAPEAGTDETYRAPRNLKEKRLAAIWSDLLGISENEIGIDANFFKLGGNSLKAIKLLARINKEFNVDISLVKIFRLFTLKDIADYIEGAIKERHIDIRPVELKEYYRLSSAQKRLYILQQMDVDSTVYNMPLVLNVAEGINRGDLQKIFRMLVRRHESFRTSFTRVREEPVQQIYNEVEVEIESYNLAAKGTGEKEISDFVRPFDLSRPPLLRVGLTQGGTCVLLIDLHHIISDGASMRVLLEEFRQLFDNGKLPQLRLQYKDYAHWQQSETIQEKMRAQEVYWLREFRGDIPVLNLSTDYSRPATQSFEGSSFRFEISPADTTSLKQLAISHQATLYLLLLAIFNILMSKLSGQEDIVVGTPIAGRLHSDLERVIGMFVNTLALRNYPSGEKRFVEFFEEVGFRTLESFENQEYQFEDLVEKVEVNRDASRNPLFDVMFSFDSDDSSPTRTSTDRSDEDTDYNFTNRVARFDMTFITLERDGVLYIAIEYCTKLFRAETIERYAGYFKKILSIVIGSPELKVADIDIISEEEKSQLAYDLNNTDAEFPRDKTIHQVFEEQLEKRAEWAAVVFKDITLTYCELNHRADHLAVWLRRCGMANNKVVGLLLQRSAEMMIGLLAILKSNGAYLPLDPLKPGSRLQYMLQDSSARILFTTRRFSEIIESDADILCIDEYKPESVHLPSEETAWHDSGQLSNPLAYVIYTSGSTGQPKGAMIEHRSVMNRLNWMQKSYPIGVGDVLVQKTPFDFDVSVWELFWWCFPGASVCFLTPGAEKDPEAIADAIERYRISTIHFVPSMLNAFLSVLEEGDSDNVQRLKCLKQVFASGEALGLHQVWRFYELFQGLGRVRLINLYGPTEATVDVSYFDCPRSGQLKSVPIGKPIDNIRLFVLDKNDKPVPFGVSGELHIGGSGLGRGYLNRPELTADKFIHSQAFGSRKLYKTGDRVRWLADGNLEFLGRLDYQVKIRGNRIELGEIEKRLHDFPAVREVVVTVREEESGDRALTAYVVPTDQHAPVVRRLLELERKSLDSNRNRYVWPNGMTLYYLNRGESDFMYREIFQENSYLRHGITLNPGACVFDLGANIGIFSLFVNHICPDAEIYAFEPIPPVFEVLNLNMMLYGKRVKVFNYGISSQENEVDLTFYPHATILSSEFADKEQETEVVRAFISSRGIDANEESIADKEVSELLENRLESTHYKCRMKPLSRVIEENGIDRIDLLKIDVEKAELNVLRSIDETDWPRILQIVIEVHDVDGRMKVIEDLLLGHGYRVTVDQDSELENTNLYNLYAVLPEMGDKKPDISESEVQQARGGEIWYSPERLIEDFKSYLLNYLPEYMVPTSFVLLEQMPLTPNGKIDKKALPNPLKAAGRDYVAPRNEVESRLAALWSEALGIDKKVIGRENNFFELGGHSLKATILVSKVQKEFKVRMPLNRIFQDSTIARMAEYIKDESKRSQVVEDENLVLLRERIDEGTHLFFIHDGTGEVDGYRELCDQLSSEFNCWGLRANRLIDHAPRDETISAIAGKYVASIRKIQSHGPYFIIGWSLGGTIAYEMALQLEKMGESIAFIGLIDAPGPYKDVQQKLIPFTLESELEYVKDYITEEDIKEKFRKISDLDFLWASIIDYLDAKNFDVDIIKRVIADYGLQALPNFEHLNLRESIYYLNVGRSLSQARANYIPDEKIQTQLHFFKASQSPEVFLNNWNDFCIQPIQSYEVISEHYSILRGNTSIKIAEIFNPILNTLK